MRILIADDDPTYRSLLQDLLMKWHFEVVLTSDGMEALAVMSNEDPPPQLLILDWDMPRLDGFELAKAIRSQTAGKDTYILMITGSRRKQDMIKVLVSGADDYLIKPFDPMDLRIHLRSAVRVLHLREELDELRRATQQEPTTAP